MKFIYNKINILIEMKTNEVEHLIIDKIGGEFR